jgi:hypothetical protein
MWSSRGISVDKAEIGAGESWVARSADLLTRSSSRSAILSSKESAPSFRPSVSFSVPWVDMACPLLPYSSGRFAPFGDGFTGSRRLVVGTGLIS